MYGVAHRPQGEVLTGRGGDQRGRCVDEPLLDAFTAGGVVDDWGRTFTGRDEIRAWSNREFIGARGTLAIEVVETTDETITVVGDWHSTFANGRSKFVFETDGDKLTRMTIREG